MSNSLAQIEMAELEELRKAFGEATDDPKVDPDGRDLAGFVAHIRGLLAEASHSDRVSVSSLAERLGISKPAVSRHLRTDGDIRASTMWLIAKALNRRWEVSLVPADVGAPQLLHEVDRPSAVCDRSINPLHVLGQDVDVTIKPGMRQGAGHIFVTAH